MMIADITIPDMWSLRSAFCIVGIIYMVVCLMIVGARGFSGWCSVISLWVCGVVLLIITTPDPVSFNGPQDGWYAMEPRVFSSDGIKSIDLKDLMGETCSGSGSYIGKAGVAYDIDYQVFAMHDKQADCFYINPFIFHPACLFWSPLFIALLTGSSWFATGNK